MSSIECIVGYHAKERSNRAQMLRHDLSSSWFGGTVSPGKTQCDPTRGDTTGQALAFGVFLTCTEGKEKW